MKTIKLTNTEVEFLKIELRSIKDNVDMFAKKYKNSPEIFVPSDYKCLKSIIKKLG
jgi:hypothetical protein